MKTANLAVALITAVVAFTAIYLLDGFAASPQCEPRNPLPFQLACPQIKLP